MEENKKLKYVGPSFDKVVLSSSERVAACTPGTGWYRQNEGEALPCYEDLGGTYTVPS
jgi:hypothetical protein